MKRLRLSLRPLPPGKALRRCALQFTILTAARTGEALEAEWKEIDLKGAVWTVPAKRMKAEREHRVPLTEGALHVLGQARKLHKGNVVFPKLPSDHQLSTASMTAVLKRMKRADLFFFG
jgi:integrase